MLQRRLRPWLPAIAAGMLLIVVAVVGATSNDRDATEPSVVTTIASLPPPVAAATSTTTPVSEGIAAVSDPVALTRTLELGSEGDDVAAVQRRLVEMSFDPGEVDGIYGVRTKQAVWAFEKLVMGVPRTLAGGRVTPEIWDRMQRAVDIAPRRPQAATPNHTEIYLPEQAMVIFHEDRPVLVTHISSGDDEEWCEEVTISPGELGNERGTEPLVKGVCGRSVTPGGVFRFYRRVEGRRESQLGGLYNPVYFNFGIAIHGAHEVPGRPASHGCVRIPMHISDYYQELVTWGRTTGDVVYVFDGVAEPETYGAQGPVWNWDDPDYVPSTTSTSSTTTTTVPETTTTSTSTTSTTVPDTTMPDTTTTSTSTSTTVPDTTTTSTSTAVPDTTTSTTGPPDAVEASLDDPVSAASGAP